MNQKLENCRAEVPAYYRALVPNGCRRAPWHDYRSRCIYMITINKAPRIPAFSTLTGIPGSHEWKPRAVPSPTGKIIAEEISAIKANFPTVQIMRRVIMPEHIHFVLFNTEASTYHLGDIINHFKGECTRAFHGIAEKRTDPRCELAPVFESGYHDRILLKGGQLDRMLAYVSDNPRRRLERMAHRDFHRRTMLAAPSGAPLEAYGNIHLLEDFDIEAVKVSSRYLPDELRRRKRNWFHTIQNGGVLVSPFISEEEKRVLNWACNNGGRIILITNNGFGKNYSPKGKLHALCSEGRMLIIAPARHCTSSVPTRRSICMAMNSLAESIARHEVAIPGLASASLRGMALQTV